YEGAAELHV
ncbi:hypothetical protein BN1708_019847, partial [Verticillium longisporum]